MDCLYHYCSNNTCFSILNEKSFRLSDIQKSNDYRELSLFFPGVLYELENLYYQLPFSFQYKKLEDREAFLKLLSESRYYWQGRYLDGDFTNYVFCLSEEADVLSQWRGYAKDGKGCCLGFSKKLLENYCKSRDNVLRLEKVEYLTDDQLNELTHSAANICFDRLKTLRAQVVENETHDNNNPETDLRVHFLFDTDLETVFLDSLRFKSNYFSEEKEWRIFLDTQFLRNRNGFIGMRR